MFFGVTVATFCTITFFFFFSSPYLFFPLVFELACFRQSKAIWSGDACLLPTFHRSTLFLVWDRKDVGSYLLGWRCSALTGTYREFKGHWAGYL
ncbi:hypothetical protein B0J18DRAFT_441458 [Chaetomium sp. MPI-SDFR-AT-0129]|nr:hypothetical protein B0J18DRAFT_441458 [Chaetomium sp. MPI-SDFR-AT-0129]